MITTLNRNSNPQPSFGIQASTVPIYTPQGKVVQVTTPVQIVGLVPLTCNTEDPRMPAFTKCDCREWANDDCYINPVFGTTLGIDPNKNDHSMFLIEFPFLYSYQWNDPTASLMQLQKYDGASWSNVTSLTDDTYGTYYGFNSLGIRNWKGFNIDWRLVLIAFGEGMYRFRVQYTFFTTSGIMVSEPFCLKEWSCAGTDVTVRWECVIEGGVIGSIVDDKRLFKFCYFNPKFDDANSVRWVDMIRVYAFFGKEKTEYKRVNVEYANGEVIQVRNEAIQTFEYESALQPKWVHDRLKAYAFMSDELYATDYNWNNSDYEIDRKRVTCDGSYEPEYHKDTRFSFVKVQFKEGFQNVIREKCCTMPKKTGGP